MKYEGLATSANRLPSSRLLPRRRLTGLNSLRRRILIGLSGRK